MVNSFKEKAAAYFKEIGISFSDFGLHKNICEWGAKKSKLISLLRRHPDWREEEFAIVTTITEKRELDRNYFNYYDNLYHGCLNGTKEGDAVLQKLTSFVESNYNGGDLPFSYIIRFSQLMSNNSALNHIVHNCFSETIDDDQAESINAISPEFKFKGGQKSSRVLNKVFQYFGFDKLPEYNRLFAKMSDCISPKIFKRTAVLSVNPMDYLTMSNGNSWSNCMCLIPSRNYDGFEYQGKHKAGCMSYLTDSTSLIFYTLDYDDYKCRDLWKIPKLTRQVIFYDTPHIVHERIYPKSIDYIEDDHNPYVIYRNCVWNIIAKCENTGSDWIPNDTIIYGNANTFMYPDWLYYTTLRYVNKNMPKDNNTVIVGGDVYCLQCGNQKYRSTLDVNDKNCESLYCTCCTDSDNEEADNDSYDDDDYDNDDYY